MNLINSLQSVMVFNTKTDTFTQSENPDLLRKRYEVAKDITENLRTEISKLNKSLDAEDAVYNPQHTVATESDIRQIQSDMEYLLDSFTERNITYDSIQSVRKQIHTLKSQDLIKESN